MFTNPNPCNYTAMIKHLKLAVCGFLLVFALPVCAQSTELKAGDTFTGTVWGHMGPLQYANVRQWNADRDFYDIAVTDSLGRFTMRVSDPDNRFAVTGGFHYYNVDIVPTAEPMDIRLELKPRRVYPDDHWTFVKSSYSDVSNQPVMPDEYICGYVVHPINFAEQWPWYGMFLKKDDRGYMVVLRYGGGSHNDTLRIGNDLARRLEGSVRLTLDKADAVDLQLEEYRREDEAISQARKDSSYGDADIISITLNEGSILYAVMPGRAAHQWAAEIPDRVWNDLYHQFDRNLGFEPDPWSWSGYGFGDTEDDGYAVISYANFLRYRYDTETGQAAVEYNDSKRPQGDLYIEPGVTACGRTFPVTAIDAGALDNCNALTSVSIPASVTSIGERAFRYCELNSVELSSVTPIACPVNAFDESVYRLATLRVPKGWNQKKAARKGRAWGKFRNVQYF